MQTIFLPTDYSDAANNALEFTLHLAKKTNAGITLFHSYHLPIVLSEGQQVPVITYEEMGEENEKRIALLKGEIEKKYPGVTINTKVNAGFAVDEIVDAAHKQKADLIIMGMKGAGKVEELLIGSNTTGVIAKTKIPVLVIPEKANFKEIKNICLACDYDKDVIDEKVITNIKKFVSLFNANLLVLNVLKPDTETSYEKALTGIKLENILKDIPHKLYFPENKNIEEGIQEFIDSHQVDLLIMLPKKLNMIERLFNKSHTKKMAFHSDIPLLAIPV